jgi:hypothetical protein
LHKNPALKFSAEGVAKELRLSVESTKSRLSRLLELGLALMDNASASFNPASPDARVVSELARLYSERRTSVITAIFTKPDKLRTFADAFRIKKGH